LFRVSGAERKLDVLPIGASDDVHQLSHLLPLLRAVAAGDGVLDAVSDVLAQHLLLDLPEGSAHGGDLRHHVDAVPVLRNHAGEATDLALDTPKAFEAGVLGFRLHGLKYTLRGYKYQVGSE
jgi:hypothetical protein